MLLLKIGQTSHKLYQVIILGKWVFLSNNSTTNDFEYLLSDFRVPFFMCSQLQLMSKLHVSQLNIN